MDRFSGFYVYLFMCAWELGIWSALGEIGACRTDILSILNQFGKILEKKTKTSGYQLAPGRCKNNSCAKKSHTWIC